MVSCKKLFIVLLIVLVILLMLFGTAWSLETEDQAKKGLPDDSSLEKSPRNNQPLIWYLEQIY